PFDQTFIKAGTIIQITEGINVGTWTVLSVDKATIKLNKTTGIQSGTRDTPITYKIPFIVKNRTNEGFSNIEDITNVDTATNLRHNPKYHLARWWRYFGSGLQKKAVTEEIKVTDYKNNSEAEMTIFSDEMENELQGSVKVGADATIDRLLSMGQSYFN